MAKSVDFDQIVDDVDAEGEEFGQGIDEEIDETPESPSAEDTTPEDGEEGLDISPPEVEETDDDVTIRGLASEYGFELPEDGEDVDVLQGFFGQTAQLRDWAVTAQEQNRQLQQQLQQLQYQVSQQAYQPQQQAPEPEKPAELTGLLKHWQAVPEFHEDWLNLVKYDENGDLVSKPGADPTLPQKIEAYNRWQRQAQQSLLSNPQQFVFEAMNANPSFQQAIQQQIHQAVHGLQDSLNAQRIAEQRSAYLYQTNDRGERQLTPAGQAYVTAVQLATNSGVQDNNALDQLGMMAASRHIQDMQAQQQAQQEAAKETPSENKRKRQLNWSKQQAKKGTNRGNSASKRQSVKEYPKTEADLERSMRERFEEAGIDLTSSAL